MYNGLCAHFQKVSRDNESISAIISFAAEDEDPPARQVRESLLHELRDASPGIFHERQTRDVIPRRRQAVNVPHLRSGQNFHG
jgi:hypothetical protein